MIRPANEGIDVWLCVEPVDFRKQITGLATLVQDAMAMDPFSTQLFVFTNRRRTQCRILYWERCGFVLWQKRLEGARFLKPEIVAAIAEDTRRHATEWSLRFRECGIDPAIYLWDGSPCVFPAYGAMPGAGRSPNSEGSLPRTLLLPTALRSTTMTIRSTCGHSSSPANRFARRAPTATS